MDMLKTVKEFRQRAFRRLRASVATQAHVFGGKIQVG
jgi:hypothetical protein